MPWVIGGICLSTFASVTSAESAGSIAAAMLRDLQVLVWEVGEKEGQKSQTEMRDAYRSNAQDFLAHATFNPGRRNLPIEVLAFHIVHLVVEATTAAAVALVAAAAAAVVVAPAVVAAAVGEVELARIAACWDSTAPIAAATDTWRRTCS